jgi:putative transposase
MATRSHPDVPREPHLITAVTYKRNPLFQDRTAAALFVQELGALRKDLGFLILAYVVMPDHVHLVIVPGEAVSLPKIMQYVKGRFARRCNSANGVTGKVWQSRYDETLIRDDSSLSARIDYVEANPVVAGIVDEPRAHPFSSAASGNGDLEAYFSGEWPG